MAILDLPFQSIGPQYQYLQNNNGNNDKMSIKIKCNDNYGGCMIFIKQIKLECDVDWQWKISSDDWMSFKHEMINMDIN